MFNKPSILTTTLMLAEAIVNAGRYESRDKLKGIDIKKRIPTNPAEEERTLQPRESKGSSKI